MSKGSEFERQICRQLSLWWSDDENDAIFWRTSNSGGRASVRAKSGKNTKNSHGDIMAIDPSGQPLIDLICWELKRGYNSHTIQDLLDKPEGGAKQQHEKWFEKAEIDRDAAGATYWALIVKRDRREPLVFMSNKLKKNLPQSLDWSCLSLKSTLYIFDLYATTLDLFLQILTPEWVKKQFTKVIQ